MLTGGCLCGAVRYEYYAEITEVIACHCLSVVKRRARRSSPMPIDIAHFKLLSGADALKSYQSSAGKHRVFCGVWQSVV